MLVGSDYSLKVYCQNPGQPYTQQNSRPTHLALIGTVGASLLIKLHPLLTNSQ